MFTASESSALASYTDRLPGEDSAQLDAEAVGEWVALNHVAMCRRIREAGALANRLALDEVELIDLAIEQARSGAHDVAGRTLCCAIEQGVEHAADRALTDYAEAHIARCRREPWARHSALGCYSAANVELPK